MTISVLMSVYYKEKPEYLNRALTSIWDDQTLKPSQIVLVEDGPLGEELLSVIDQWQGKLSSVLCLLANETILGLTKSLNKGIKVITSDLIARFDTDDVCLPTRFELQEKFLKENPDIDVVGGAVEVIDKAGNMKYIKHSKLKHEELIKEICWKCPLPHPGVMMRTSMFTVKGLSYNEEFRNSQDICLWVDAVLAGCKLANLPEEVIQFTEDDEVYTRRGKVRAMNEYKSFARAAKEIYGKFSPRRILPVVRYIFRRMSVGIIKNVYNGPIMKKIFKK